MLAQLNLYLIFNRRKHISSETKTIQPGCARHARECNDVSLLPTTPPYFRYFRTQKAIIALFYALFLPIFHFLSNGWLGPTPDRPTPDRPDRPTAHGWA